MKSVRTTLVLVVAMLTAGCSGGELPPVFVGHVAPQSGSERHVGEAEARGIRLAVLEANQDVDQGAGRKVKVIHTDTTSNPKAFEAQAIRLVTVNRVVALLGGMALDEVEQLERGRVPLVSPYGQQSRSVSDTVFCTGLAAEFVGRVLARFAYDDLKKDKIAILVDETREDALLLAEGFAREFATRAKQSQAATPVPLRFGRGVSVERLAESLRVDAPSLLLFAGKVEDLRTLRRTLGGKPIPVLFGGAEGSAHELQSYPETASDVYVATAFHPDVEAPRARAFTAKYTKTFAEEPDVHSALAYENAWLLFEALRQTKDQLTLPKLRENLAGLKDFPGLTGSLSFGEDRRARRPAFVAQIQERRLVLVKQFAQDE